MDLWRLSGLLDLWGPWCQSVLLDLWVLSGQRVRWPLSGRLDLWDQ